MKLTKDFKKNLDFLRTELNVKKSFDVLEKVMDVHNTKFYCFYLDGFVKDTNMEYVRRDLYDMSDADFNSIHNIDEFVQKAISSIEADTSDDTDAIIKAVLSGQSAIICDKFEKAILLDFRTYPARGVDEPDKEKVLRGAHDGFVETIVCNTALIRRRIRDPKLTFEMFSLGSITQTDVAVGYLDSTVDRKTLNKVIELIKNTHIEALTLGDESFIEILTPKNRFNPFPRARYTERPDVVAAELVEGRVAILIDNSPSVLILPANIFDFFQSIDDYYLPVLTGNYLKFLRYCVLFVNIFLTPVYILLTDNPQWLVGELKFLLPQEPYVLPLLLQFLIAEAAIDGLKLASLNTPNSLGTSLSIIGGLILGDYTVQTGWFTPQTILYMAIVSLSSFVQPSIELGFAVKFQRIILLVLTSFFSTWGFVAGIIINFIMLATTKTITGERYLYPLFPFNANALKHVLFRCKKEIGNKKN